MFGRVIVDRAIYRDGQRAAEPHDLGELWAACRDGGGIAPKLERYGDTLFCVLRPARYVDETETVELGRWRSCTRSWTASSTTTHR
jgi:magnesium transporter